MDAVNQTKALQGALGYEFSSPALLQQALTHRSHGSLHNERLEFLGDSVLNCVVAALLFEKFGKIDEGDLSRLRANLVKQQSLYEIAQRLELSPYLRLGEGELKSGGFRRPSILADAVEALFGAIFLDGGFDAARATISKLYKPILVTVDPQTLGKDAKTLLQEYLQSRKIALPTYTVIATRGAAHSQEFEVECLVPKLSIQVNGAGASRRAAEQAAAKRALEEAQALALQAGKRSRKPRQAQLTLSVAVEQQAASVEVPTTNPNPVRSPSAENKNSDKSSELTALAVPEKAAVSPTEIKTGKSEIKSVETKPDSKSETVTDSSSVMSAPAKVRVA